MEISLGVRTEETAAVYFQRARSPAIRKTLPQRAQTLEEAFTEDGAASAFFKRTL